MADALLIGLTGLSAQQRAIEVTSHNITNSATPGYSRQRAELQAYDPENTRPGMLGRGVAVDAIRRIADTLVDERLRQAQSDDGRYAALLKNLQAIETAFTEPGEDGLSAATNRMFSALEDLAADPEDRGLRAATTQQLGGWTESVSTLGRRLQDLRTMLRGSLDDEARQINDLSGRIAKLNQSIRIQVNIGSQPNDLIDQRDQLVRDLSRSLDVRTIRNGDGSVTVSADGHQIVGTESANAFRVVSDSDGVASLVLGVSDLVKPRGGTMGAVYELNREIMPAITARVDDWAATTIKQVNALHAVSTSDSYRQGTVVAASVIAAEHSDADLDDPLNALALGAVGISPEATPSFTDALGQPVVRDLTINILDVASGTAVKHVLRYDPTTGSGSRSLDDLVHAINTGHGGGFTLQPSSTGGVDGLTARLVQVSGGVRLQLDAAPGKSVDFSPALDQRPADQSWTGPAVTVAQTTAGDPALAGQRLMFRWQAADGAFKVFSRDPTSGSEIPYGGGTGLMAPSAAPVVLGALTVTAPLPASGYRDGDSFAVEFDASGQVMQASGGLVGPHVETPTWTAGDANVTVRGRYTGQLGYDPAHPWSLRVVQSGVVGAADGTAAPGNPAVVEVTWYEGETGAERTRTAQVILDDRHPAGSRVALGDGVWLEFGEGRLSTVGNTLDWHVDAHPDDAGLLPALGINRLLQGHDAASMAIDERIAADPSQLAVGRSRVAGDNAGLRALADLRSARTYAGDATIDSHWQATVSDVATRIAQAQRGQDSQAAVTASLDKLRAQVSGVSIDDEVGALILHQQAYQAAARIVSTARENIQALLAIMS